MTPAETNLVKVSWSIITPIAEMAVELSCSRLFEVYPEVQLYFKGDMKGQG